MIKRILQISGSDAADTITLRKRSDEVRAFGTRFLENTIRDLTDTLTSIDIAVGLSAVQIGTLSRVFVIDTDKIALASGDRLRRKQGIIVMINPEIIHCSKAKEKQKESCLSMVLFEGEVERPVGIRVAFNTMDGTRKAMSARGLLARVILHERDHLDGILYTDKLVRGAKLIPVAPEDWAAER